MILNPILIFPLVVLLYLANSIKILPEYERGVIFRLGKLLPHPKGPGIVLVFAPIDRMVRVGLRTIVMDVPSQDIITRDNVSVKVNAVIYFRVMEPNGGRSSKSRATTTPHHSSLRRPCGACWDRSSWTTCCPSGTD